MKAESRVRLSYRASIACTAMLCLLATSSSTWGIAVDPSANLGAVAPEAGTGLRGQYFDSTGTVATIRTLLNASTAPDRTWNVTTVDYPQGGGNNTTADNLGLRNLLGTDRTSLSPIFDVFNVDNSRFAMRGYINVTAAMDLVAGGAINVNLQLNSDDDGNIVIGGGLDADGTTGPVVGLNLARNTLHAIEFPTAGFYQFDVIYQEGGGNTGATLQGQFANVNPAALAIIPNALLVPNNSQTPAALNETVVAVPGGPSLLVGAPGLQGFFFDSAGDLNSIRTLLNNNTPADRTWRVTTVDYPKGGGHNTIADASGLIALLGADAASLTGGGDIANTDSSRFAMRGFLQIDSAMDLDPVAAGIQIMLHLESDDDGNIVFNGGSDANGTTPAGSGLNLARNIDHFLTFSLPGGYQMDILWQEGGGSTGITLLGQFANINNGNIGVVPANLLFVSVPEPATASLGLLGLALLARRRRHVAA